MKGKTYKFLDLAADLRECLPSSTLNLQPLSMVVLDTNRQVETEVPANIL